MTTFKQKINSKYQVVEAKLSGIREHPLSDRIKLLKKVEPEEGGSTVLAYDLPEGIWTKLFGIFTSVFKEYDIPIKQPLDKTPHVTLAYIINAKDEEIEKAKTLATSINAQAFKVNGVTFLVGVDKNVYVVLDLTVTSAYRKLYNSIQNMVGRNRLREFRTFWKGHIPHASIGIIDKKYKDLETELKEAQQKLSKIVRQEKIVFIPKFIEVHKNTQLNDLFTPELVDYKPLLDA